MAITKAKRSVHPAQLNQAARRNNRRASNRHPERRKPAERRTWTRSSDFRRSKPRTRSHCNARSTPYRRLVLFPQAKGKVIETVEFSTCSDYHNISINFRDKTCLNFSIEAGFTLQTDYSDWKSGNQRVVRIWPTQRNKA